MPWIGWTSWTPPDSHVNVDKVIVEWRGDNEFVVFWCAQNGSHFMNGDAPGYYNSALYGQRGSVTDDGVFEFDPAIAQLATYDINLEVARAERSPDGDFAVFVHYLSGST